MSFAEDMEDALTESWNWFRSLDYWNSRWVFGAAFVFIGLTVVAWKFMVPLIVLALGTTLYLRRSRGNRSL